MSTLRPGTAGATRACPHCKATILESAPVCPACRHHLRFDEAAVDAARAAATQVPLKVEGTVHHPADAEPFEYTAVIVVRDENGMEIERQVMAVGALRPGQTRSFTLSVEMTPHKGAIVAPRAKRRLS